jgi:hypothetical protein
MPSPRGGAIFAGLLVAMACSESPPPASADTVPPVADSPAADAPIVVQQARPSGIGRMALLGEPMSGSCTSEGDPLVATRFTYEGDWPLRTVRVEVADTSRTAQPTMLEVQGRQRVTSYGETETIYVLFNRDGAIERGSRRYFTDENPPTLENAALLPADSGQARALAAQVLAWCRRPSARR